MELKKLLITDSVLESIKFKEFEKGIFILDLGGIPEKETGRSAFYQIQQSNTNITFKLKENVTITTKEFTSKEGKTIVFLHDIYESINDTRTKEELERFESICKERGLNEYIKSYKSHIFKSLQQQSDDPNE